MHCGLADGICSTQEMREVYDKLERLVVQLADLLDKDMPPLPPEEPEPEEFKLIVEDLADVRHHVMPR